MNNCKQSQGHIHEELNYPRSVKFCKILAGDFSRRMSIPLKLVGWFKENLSGGTEIIDLKGPSGNKWHVGLGKSTAGSVFLQYGWKEFVEDNYLEENDILVFKYEGDSCFSVSIFDSSECERESSYFSKNEHLEKQEAAEEYSLKTVEQSTAAAHESYHCSSRSIHNVGYFPEKSSPSDSDQRGEFGCSEKREDIASSKPEVVGARSLGNQSERRNLPRRLPTDAERDAAMQLARAFTPSRPSFLTVMKADPSRFCKGVSPSRKPRYHPSSYKCTK